MEIIQNLVSEDMYHIKCPYKMHPIGISVHNTDNSAPARNEIAYMRRNNLYVSFHYAIDEAEIVQGIPEDRNAWHSGDGQGPGNMQHIGIEICYSAIGGDLFDKAERNAAKFIAYKLQEYGWTIANVKKHQDFDGKYCPSLTLTKGWQRFLDMIQAELDALKTGFVDVPVGTYYTDAVIWAVENGIAYGIDEDHFAPENVCTRAQAVTFLWRLKGSPKVDVQIPFEDVSADAYYTDAIKWAVKNGITAGIDATHFAPDAPCTRSQIVTFIYRAQGSPASSKNEGFVDVNPENWYYLPVCWAVENGITAGIDADHFGPDQECTRAQMVTFLYRI